MKRNILDAVGVLAAITLLGQIPSSAITPSSIAAESLFTWPEMSIIDLANRQEVLQLDFPAPRPDFPAAQPWESGSRNRYSDGFTGGFTDGYAGCSSCCDPQPRHTWVSGFEATFLQPNIHGRDIQSAILDPALVQIGTFPNVDAEEFYASPRAWFGLQGCQWGLNLRFWELANAEAAFVPFETALSSTTWGRLDVYTIDAEVTKKICIYGHHMVGSIGVRYSEFDHQQSVSGLQVVGGDLFQAAAITDQHLSAIGPTVSLNGMHPVNSGKWNVFWNVRGSALFGETRLGVQTSASATGFGVGAATVNTALAVGDETLWIGECQLGLQRDYRLECIPARAFFRFGLEYQYWDAESAGGAFATSFATLGADVITNSASATDVRMDLIGFAIATGFHW